MYRRIQFNPRLLRTNAVCAGWMSFINNFLPIVLVSILVWSPSTINSQSGGNHIYQFINLPSSARTTGLGGYMISVADGDAGFVLDNPSIQDSLMTNSLSIQHMFYTSDTHLGQASYKHYIKPWRITLHGGFKYVHYGTFRESDIYGNETGQFKSNEVALVLGASKYLFDRLSVGCQLKYVQSNLAHFTSNGIALDLGAYYTIPENNLSFGFVIKNLGVQLTKYDEQDEYWPLDVEIGITKRLRHLPFRYSITFHHLNRWNLLYDDPVGENNIFEGNTEVEASPTSQWIDNMFRHMVFSGEFILGKNENIFLRIAYNHLNRRELSVGSYRSLTGFSTGFGLKLKRFKLDYGYTIQHLDGGNHHLGIGFTLSQMSSKI